MLKSTGDFIKNLHSYKFSSRQKLVSFDIIFLYTNVLLEEAIKLIANKLFSKKNKSTINEKRNIY